MSFSLAPLLWAQNAPIDFEPSGHGANFSWTVFENNGITTLNVLPNPDASGLNTSATVASIAVSQQGAPWAGCETLHGSDIGSWTINSSNHLIRIMVWKSVISDVGIKLVKPDGWSLGEIKKSNTTTGQWEQLEFDFSAHIGQTYDQIVIFPDFQARAADHVVYFDNVYGAAASVGMEETSLADVRIFPNPTTGTFHLTSDEPLVQVEVLDAHGRLLFTLEPKGLSAEGDLSSLPAGIYAVRCTTESGILSSRILRIDE